jgi:ribosomal protein S18 acetylase RimI-like enzyme
MQSNENENAKANNGLEKLRFSIIKAQEKDCQILTDIGKISFIESHGSSASSDDINQYVSTKYTNEVFKTELNDTKNIYHLIKYKNEPAGYSKIILNDQFANIQLENVAKLERLYLLKEFYNLKLGLELLYFNIELAKQNNQIGMWLFVWKENHKAFDFYKKMGFEIIGDYNFKISETHSNPNHQLLLRF